MPGSSSREAPSPDAASAAVLVAAATAPWPAHRGPPTFAPIPLRMATPAPPQARGDHLCCALPARPTSAEVFLPTDGLPGTGRFAYALIEPAAASPGFLLRRALEERVGNPHVGLAASDYGTMLLVFSSDASREATLGRFPFSFDGHEISLVRPEEGENRSASNFQFFAQLSAVGFPLEHWSEGGIRAAFSSIGSVCCIDPLCLNGKDYSVVRLVIKLLNSPDAPPMLFVRDAATGSSTEVRIRTVRVWPWDGDSSSPRAGHFEAWAAPFPGDVPLGPRLSDIDEFSVPGEAPSSPCVARQPVASIMNLWGRIVERRHAGMARASAMDDIDGVPREDGPPQAPVPPGSPVELWDRILSRRLATQFPETGMDADQWYDTLNVPATPLVPSSEDDTDGFLGAKAAVAIDGDVAVLPASGALPFDDHEDAVRKQRVRRKRAVDSAFKPRRSSRLASKEPASFVNMLTKAKAMKASRFDLSGGSHRLRVAADAAGFMADYDPGPLPLPRLQELPAACGVDPDAIAVAGAVSSSSE